MRGISRLSAGNTIPNPATTNVNFEIPGDITGNMTLSILDLKGAVVARHHVNGGELSNSRLVWHIPGEVNNGIYLYRMETGVKTYSGQLLISR